MDINKLKQEMSDYLSMNNVVINEENREFVRGSLLVIFGEKYQTRPQNDEIVFGKIVDEVLDEFSSISKSPRR